MKLVASSGPYRLVQFTPYCARNRKKRSRNMKMIGLILIIAGAIGIIWGGIGYIKDRDTTHIGPVDIVVEEKGRVPIPPLVGVAALVAGGLMVGMSSRRKPGLTL